MFWHHIMNVDANALNTHPELVKPTHVISGFWGHPCPKIADNEQNIKKISFSYVNNNVIIFVHLAYKNLCHGGLGIYDSRRDDEENQ